MAKLPLLMFPQPRKADRDPDTGRGPKIHSPPVERQSERVGPKLETLQQSFTARSVELQQDAEGADPEQVLVIETVSSVKDFANAVVKIPGLEWMGDLEIEEIAPDEDFYDERSEDKPLTGRLYLLMSNQRALNQMLSLWGSYQQNPRMKWEYGLTKFRDIFNLLHDIRRWGIRDRLEETGVLAAWKEDLEHFPHDPVKFEVELWFRQSKIRRAQAEDSVKRLILSAGGEVLSSATIEEIAYHAVLAVLPRSEIERILENEATELVKCEQVMFFRPVGQMAAGKNEVLGNSEPFDSPFDRPIPSGPPTVAVLDGCPVENHALLQNRILLDDPDDFAPDCPISRRNHGTSMCSLVIHGDLSTDGRSLSRPIYVRPILKPVRWHREPWPEELPRSQLVLDLIHRAVKRICEGDGNTAAVAPSVRVINLSIGDPSRPFYQLVSSLARLLDWLSYKYDVLFVVSAGNQLENIVVDVSEDEFRSLSPEERQSVVIRALYRDARNRRIFSPAESINSLTVGAAHSDGSEVTPPARLIDVFTELLPSPISAFGGGYRRSLKPDIVLHGGKVLHDFRIGSNELECRVMKRAPGVKSATSGTTPGDLSQTQYSVGTSNASALLSHHLGHYYESLIELLDSQNTEYDGSPFIAPLLKAMAVHGCSWETCRSVLWELFSTETDGHSLRHWVGQWLGYGFPDTQRVLECTEQRATVLGFGELTDGDAHEFDLPLPPSLGSRKVTRRLSVTLAWISPIVPTQQKYRSAGLWFNFDNQRIGPTRKDAQWREVRRGTVQHEVFEGEDPFAISEGEFLPIRVNCRKDAGRLNKPVKYGIAVTLEVAEGLPIPVYNEVRTRIRVRPGIGIRP